MSVVNMRGSKPNFQIQGKNVEEFACYLCGTFMSIEEVEVNVQPCYLEFGQLEWNPVSQEATIQYRCPCGVRCELSFPDRAIEVGYREPKEPEFWEYVIMGISSVKYGRVSNLGNFETERLEAEVILSEGQTADEALVEARTFVNRKLGLGPSDADIEAARRVLEDAGQL